MTSVSLAHGGDFSGDESDVDPNIALDPVFGHVDICSQGFLRDEVLDAELGVASASSAGEGI